MKLIFLGTSATWPLPRKGRKCSCKICQSKDERDKRSRSAILLLTPNKKSKEGILIDAGPDILKELRRAKIAEIKALLITHAHSDHLAGLKGLKFKKLIPLYALEEVHQKIKKNFGSKVAYLKKVIRPFREFKIDTVKFKGLVVEHSQNFTTLAYLIIFGSKGKEKKIVYMPDYKKVPQKSQKLMANCDLLILGGSILKKVIPWHSPIVEGINLAQKLKAKKVYFTHLGHQTLPHQELERFVQEKGGPQFKIAYDGLTLNLDKIS